MFTDFDVLDFILKNEETNDIFFDIKKEKSTENTILDIYLPGFKKEEIQIELFDDYFIVSGERKKENEKDFIYIQKSSPTFLQKFSKKFNLLEKIEDIEAKFENGILTLILKKPQKTIRNRKISIS